MFEEESVAAQFLDKSKISYSHMPDFLCISVKFVSIVVNTNVEKIQISLLTKGKYGCKVAFASI